MFVQIQREMVLFGSGPACFLLNLPTASFLQLDNRYFYSGIAMLKVVSYRNSQGAEIISYIFLFFQNVLVKTHSKLQGQEAVHDEQVSYLHVTPLKTLQAL